MATTASEQKLLQQIGDFANITVAYEESLQDFKVKSLFVEDALRDKYSYVNSIKELSPNDTKLKSLDANLAKVAASYKESLEKKDALHIKYNEAVNKIPIEQRSIVLEDSPEAKNFSSSYDSIDKLTDEISSINSNSNSFNEAIESKLVILSESTSVNQNAYSSAQEVSNLPSGALSLKAGESYTDPATGKTYTAAFLNGKLLIQETFNASISPTGKLVDIDTLPSNIPNLKAGEEWTNPDTGLTYAAAYLNGKLVVSQVDRYIIQDKQVIAVERFSDNTSGEVRSIDKPATVGENGGTSASGDIDIYDPNLTQEQLASLSAADLRARDSYFKGEGVENYNTLDQQPDLIVDGKPANEPEAIPPPPTPYVEPLLFKPAEDWRVRIALGPEASYLYKASEPGILAPLAITDGVIFPYTPTLGTNYSAHYDATHPIHSNYKVHHYSNSSVEQLSLTCDFTAQNTFEANYLLAVIHLFKSATKMFYGKDESPSRGTPPPLFYLYGFGAFQFEAQPFVISNFAYSLPPDVDYIRADTNLAAGSGDSIPYSSAGEPPTDRRGQTPKYLASTTGTKIVGQSNLERLGVFDSNGNFKNPNASSNPPLPEGIQKGGGPSAPKFTTVDAQAATYVPSRINITITGLPIQSRRQVSNKFSLKDYATGKLIRGSTLAGGGFW